MRLPWLLLLLLLLLVPVLAGCPSPYKRVASSNLEVSEMQPKLEARSDGHEVSFDVELRRNGYDVIELDAGDALTARIGDATRVLTKVLIEESPHYVGSLPADPSNDTVLVSLVRRPGKAGAPLSSATLPPPFEIAGVAPTTVAPDGIVKVQLAGAPPSKVRIKASGACAQIDIGDREFDVEPSTLTVTINPQDLHLSGTMVCNLSLVVKAVNLGTLDPAFSGDRYTEPFAAVQERTASVQVAR